MGNQLSQPQKLQPEHLAEVPKVVLKENLGGGRFLKTLLCLHDDGGLVVVKVYYKRDDVPDLRAYEARLLEIRQRLSGPAWVHVLPFQAFLESDRAAYLIRPYIFADLYHRLSTRPFLSSIEKRWIAFQLLHALAQVHERGICHGDIKCENSLVTSWNWVYLADIASYKPTYLPADNPADFSFYFDTGGRRRCYIAPERFYESGTSDIGQLAVQRLLPEMDVFSMGCVIAELFMEGKALFDLSKLLSYRRGEYDPSNDIAQVEAPMQQLILHMIQLQPGKRLSAAAYLEQWGPRLFPAYFEAVLHPFFMALLPMDADERVAAMLSSFPQFALFMQPPHSRSSTPKPEPAAGAGAAEAQMSQSRDMSEGLGSLERSMADPGGAAGGLGTQLSSVAGPAMQVDLLANVGALLADTQSLLTRLQDGDTGDANDGDFFAADPSISPGREASPAPNPAPSAAAQGSPPADEVATDEVYEFEFREEEDGPFCTRLLGKAGSRSWGGHAAARKEDVVLPPEGGWQWTSDWQVETQAGSSDGEGWQYREPSPSGAAEARPANPVGEHGWSARSGPNCNWRRRRWVRHRRRRQHAWEASIVAAGYQGRDSAANGMVLITVLLCTLVRGAKLQEAKTRAVALLSKAAALCDDDTRLQRVVPYLLSMTLKGEAPASVQCAALRSLSHVLSTIDTVPTSDAKIFNEYILPALSLIPAEAEESVRVEYAGILAQLAATAHRFLMRLQMPAASAQQQAAGAAVVRYEEQMGALRSAFTGVFQDLVVSPRSTPFSRRAILPHLPHLATVLGRKLSNDFLLPTMITFLNDRDWQTRAAFFRDVSCIASQAGFSGMEAFLLPCVEQALADESEAVIAEAIMFLTRVVEGGHMRKRSLLAATARVAAKLQHCASTAVRAAASDFIAAAARSLSPAETYALLTPLVMPAMATEPVIMTDPRSVSACFRPASNDLHDVHGEPVIGTCRYSGRPPLSSRPTSSSGRNGSLLQQLPSAPLYTVTIDPKFLRPGASRLTAALEGLNASGQDGHIIARADSGPAARRAAGSADGGPPPQHAADIARLVAHAKRLNKPTAEMASVSGRLAAGVRSIHLSSESPLSFQPGGASRGISDAIDAAIHTDLPAHPYAANLASSTPWQPRGVLVAHLAEHKRAVNRIAVAPNGAFFVTASNDETCKIWDSRRLEKDISFRSKLTYASQGGKILAVAACEEAQSVASASSNGSVHVWRVEYTSRSGGAPDRYTGIIGKRQAAPGEGAVLEVMQWGSLLLYATQRGGIHAWDLRADTNAWTLPTTSNQGVLERLAVDTNGQSWLLTGSSRGQLTLWDMRFQLAVNSIQQPQGFPIEALAPALAPPTRLGLQESSLATPLVYVAAGPQEIGLWDVEQGKCHQVLRVIGKEEPDSVRSEIPSAIRRAQKALPPAMDAAGLARHLSVAELQAPPQRPAGCRALLPTGAGPLLSGGSDGCVRFWDAARPDASFMVSGPPQLPASPAAPHEAGSALGHGNRAPLPVAYVYSHKTMQGVGVVEESCITRSTDSQLIPETEKQHSALDRAAAICHQDGILHMTSLDCTDRILLTASHDGVVKAWK
ncbi:hypothetical protein WJX75_008190 [Coccomyxa subellipsoidea]|uniref:non-specific serine/threonine protein kinase n=1 Tax=Coccomyxa subellipsoidea TaxID=248742 RepID=A0ABR2YSF7_9CHLO